MHKIGERVTWKAINRNYTGVVVGFYKDFAVVEIDGSGKRTLLDNKPSTNQKPAKDGGPGGSPGK